MLFVCVPTLFLSLFVFVLFRLSGFLQLGDKWLKGLQYCTPITAEDEKRALNPKPTGRTNKRKNDEPSLAISMREIEPGSLTFHPSYGTYLMLVYGLVAIAAGYFFEQSWYIIQALSHPDKLAREGPTKSVFLLLLLLFYIAYCLKAMVHVLRVMGRDSNEYKVSLLCGFIGFVINFVILEFPPLTSTLDFDLPKSYDVLQNNLNAFTSYFITNTSLRTMVTPESVALAIPKEYINIGLSIFGAFIASIVFLSGFRLARCHNFLQTHTSRPLGQTFSGVANVGSFVALLMWVKPFKDWTVDIRIPSGLETDAYDIVITADAWEIARMTMLLWICFIRLGLFRSYMQSFLESVISYGYFYISTSKNEAEAKVNYNAKAVAVYSLTCLVATEVLAATLLMLFSLVILFDYGGIDFGFINSALYLFGIRINTGEVVSEATTTQMTNLLEYTARFFSSAPTVFSKDVVYPLFSFFTWWYTLCLSVHTLIGYVHVNLYRLAQEDIKEAKQNKRNKKKTK